ncbi:MAG: hypothetical protein QOG07_1143 [Pseudonocardiales bacterium]|nr:hypothetical protein [Pseudonocardiales bacterium]
MLPGDEEDIDEDDERWNLAGATIWDRQVAPDFDLPEPPRTELFILEPLGEQHNAADYAAWTSSIDHIRATPGFADRDWPRVMGIADNLEDLRQHAEDFRARKGFTYAVLDPADGDVIGCVYIYPPRNMVPDVRSWVRASHAHLDKPLWEVVSGWLDGEWPFIMVHYAQR